MRIRIAGVASLVIMITGCITGRVELRPAEPPVIRPNYVVIEKPRADVWKAAIPRLSERFFVINNIDATSGLINVSYSGDPQRYVDGGMITSSVENLAGPRTYHFAATKARQTYEQYQNGNLMALERKMDLEGRINIVVEEVEASRTKVTANVRYILTKTVVARNQVTRAAGTFTDASTFNSGQPGEFTVAGKTYQYWPTGELERTVLEAFEP